MGRQKRKVFFDRNEVFQSKAKRPNISPRLEVEAVTETGKMGNYQRLFAKKFLVDDPLYLDAMVLLNDICVLFPKKPLSASSINFPIDLEIMSGRKKKGARKIKADTVVCILTLTDGSTLELRTPIGGQLLEYNELLTSNLDLLQDVSSGERYVVILYPDTAMPSPNESIEEWRAIQEAMSEKVNTCFSFIRSGQCKHGDRCKFSHVSPSAVDDAGPSSDTVGNVVGDVDDAMIEMCPEKKNVA
jgi:hypothetical protein